jgi:hypothetical protein
VARRVCKLPAEAGRRHAKSNSRGASALPALRILSSSTCGLLAASFPAFPISNSEIQSHEPGAARPTYVTPERKYHGDLINRAIELLAQDQALYYVGGHTGHPPDLRSRETGRRYLDGSFDMAGLAENMRGLVEGAPDQLGLTVDDLLRFVSQGL